MFNKKILSALALATLVITLFIANFSNSQAAGYDPTGCVSQTTEQPLTGEFEPLHILGFRAGTGYVEAVLRQVDSRRVEMNSITQCLQPAGTTPYFGTLAQFGSEYTNDGADRLVLLCGKYGDLINGYTCAEFRLPGQGEGANLHFQPRISKWGVMLACNTAGNNVNLIQGSIRADGLNPCTRQPLGSKPISNPTPIRN